MAIITVSREMGSGGQPIVQDFTSRLGYTLVDGNAIKTVAAKYGLTPEAIETADEKPPAFVDRLDEKIELDAHIIELIILEYALEGNVVIYGRGAQDLLKDLKSVFRVRIVAPFEERVERWAEREWIDPEMAHTLVRRSDQQRAGFIKYYFDRDWANPLDYDLVINSSRLSEEMAAKLVCDGVQDANLVERKEESKRRLSELIIKKKVQIILLKSEDIECLHINIEVADGHISLDGHVHSDKELRAVIALVQQTEGVKSVKDKLKIIGYRTNPEDL